MSGLYNQTRFTKAADITKSDSTLVTCNAIWVGGTGDIAFSPDGTTAAVTLKAVPVGLLPLTLEQGRIMSTNTTATSMVALT